MKLYFDVLSGYHITKAASKMLLKPRIMHRIKKLW